MFQFEKVQKIFIDFDGVIVDSNGFKERAIENSIFKLLSKTEKTLQAIKFFNSNAGISRNLKLSRFFKKEDISKILKIYNEECFYFFSKAVPTRGFIEFLDHIKCRNSNVKFYILSGGEKREIEIFLKKNLLFDYFEEILASEKNKFDHLVEKGVSENDIFIGDSKNDLNTSLEVGLRFILMEEFKSLASFPEKSLLKEKVFLKTKNFESLIKDIS